jgi:hypothetical protein
VRPQDRWPKADTSEVIPGSPADFAKSVADETEKWAKVVREANIKPD